MRSATLGETSRSTSMVLTGPRAEHSNQIFDPAAVGEVGYPAIDVEAMRLTRHADLDCLPDPPLGCRTDPPRAGGLGDVVTPVNRYVQLAFAHQASGTVGGVGQNAGAGFLCAVGNLRARRCSLTPPRAPSGAGLLRTGRRDSSRCPIANENRSGLPASSPPPAARSGGLVGGGC